MMYAILYVALYLACIALGGYLLAKVAHPRDDDYYSTKDRNAR